MTAIELDALIQRLLDETQARFNRLGHCPTHAMLIDHQRKALILESAGIRSDADIVALIFETMTAARTIKPVVILVLSEGWITSRIPGQPCGRSKRLSAEPQGMEVLSVSIETEAGMSLCVWPIERGVEVRLGERRVYGGLAGRFAGVWRRDGDSPRNQRTNGHDE